jgi:parallel beta-helix repeat protein
VSATGSDASVGSLEAPWLTLKKAADTVPIGSTVFVRAGTYGPFVMSRSGTAADPIIFRAYANELPVIDGAGVAEYTVRVTRASYVKLIGLTVIRGYGAGHRGGGILVDNSTHIELLSNTVRDNHSFGIRLLIASDVLIQRNNIYGNAVGIHIGQSGNGNLVLSNSVHDNNQMIVNTPSTMGDDAGGDGISIVNTTGTVLVAGNSLWGNRAMSYDYGYDGGAFSIYAASNWTIRDNVTWDNRNVLESGTDAARTPCDNGSFTRNLNLGATTVDRSVGMVLRCASNTLVANNTFAGLQYFVFDISHMSGGWGGSIEGLRIVNNVVSVSEGKIYGILTTLPASVVIDHNVLHNTGLGPLATIPGDSTTSLATFQSWTGLEMNGIVADPLFKDAPARDYSLQPDSPAIDQGTDVAGITDGFSGTGPDCGYVEFVLPPVGIGG